MPTTIKQALKKWEEATGKKGSEATEVKLIGVYPPIEKVRRGNISKLRFFKKLFYSKKETTRTWRTPPRRWRTWPGGS